MTEAEKQIIDLLRNVRTEVLDLKVRIHALEMHLKRQDEDNAEMLAASRRLMMTIEAIDEDDEDATEH